MCSIYNNKDTFYDSRNGNINIVNKNEYIGLDCECTNEKIEFCDHSCMINEKSFKNFLFGILDANEKIKKEQTQGFFLKNEDLENIQSECLTLTLDSNQKNVLNLFGIKQ